MQVLFWCEKRDLNPYGVTTRPSNVRVCQFRHSRISVTYATLILYYKSFELSIAFLKKIKKI